MIVWTDYAILSPVLMTWNILTMHDTLPKTTSPKSHFAEKTPCRKDTPPKSLPNFGENAEKVKKKKKEKKMRIDITIICYYKFDKSK